MTSRDEEIMEAIEYSTFLKMIDTIPSCIFFKDTNLRYLFSSHCWEQLNTEDIIGHTDLDIRKDKENAIQAMEMDREILRTGKGCDYTIKSEIDGHLQYLQLIKEPVRDEEGNIVGIVGLINDITEKTLMEQKLHELSTVDMLTKLLNRNAGTEVIEKRLKEDSGNKLFCLIDIDSFKSVNDNYGHRMGDRVLKAFGNSIKECISQDDIVMRLGGDEFILFIDDKASITSLNDFQKELCEKINEKLPDDFDKKITVSIGALEVTQTQSFDDLYNVADSKMYEAKSHGGNCVEII